MTTTTRRPPRSKETSAVLIERANSEWEACVVVGSEREVEEAYQSELTVLRRCGHRHRLNSRRGEACARRLLSAR